MEKLKAFIKNIMRGLPTCFLRLATLLNLVVLDNISCWARALQPAIGRMCWIIIILHSCLYLPTDQTRHLSLFVRTNKQTNGRYRTSSRRYGYGFGTVRTVRIRSVRYGTVPTDLRYVRYGPNGLPTLHVRYRWVTGSGTVRTGRFRYRFRNPYPEP